MSTELCSQPDKSLSRWNEAIALAKKRIKEIKRSVHVFESLRDQGMKFPEAEKEKRRKAA